ncbi:unnamed protein product [Rotaria sordida]|uniref:peptidylprolyl isomerase n=1 Tax=Rotaria sordida TaxID=392033 RepID=A0A814D254_9BILA|nr:unnamed protein product [Rotaria sordida]
MNKENYRFYIKVRTALNIQSKLIHDELYSVFSDQAPSYNTVAKWSRWFREGREDVEDQPRLDRSVTETTSENIEEIKMKSILVFCLLLILINCLFPYVLSLAEEKLQVMTIKKVENCSKRSKVGDTLYMQYTGVLKSNGEKFDSSYDRGHPFVFKIGYGQAIKGWDQGLLNMCEGEQRKLIIPPSYAYGDVGAGGVIPPGATLLMDVVCEKIET